MARPWFHDILHSLPLFLCRYSLPCSNFFNLKSELSDDWRLGKMLKKCVGTWICIDVPPGPISFILMQFFRKKIDQIIVFHGHLRSWRPHPREILDPPLICETLLLGWVILIHVQHCNVFLLTQLECLAFTEAAGHLDPVYIILDFQH